MRLFLLHKLDVLSFFYKSRSCPWKMEMTKMSYFWLHFLAILVTNCGYGLKYRKEIEVCVKCCNTALYRTGQR